MYESVNTCFMKRKEEKEIHFSSTHGRPPGAPSAACLQRKVVPSQIKAETSKQALSEKHMGNTNVSAVALATNRRRRRRSIEQTDEHPHLAAGKSQLRWHVSQRTEPLLMHVAIRGTAALEFGVLMSSIIQVCASARGEVYVHSKVTDPMHTHQFWEMLLACFPQSIASVPGTKSRGCRWTARSVGRSTRSS